VGKRRLHCSRNPSAYVANGIADSTVRSINYLIQKPGDVGFETYSLDGLRVAVASGAVQLDSQARHNGEEPESPSRVNKPGQLFIGTHNETLSVSTMRVGNKDRPPSFSAAHVMP
jgi:hypothetical protein